MAILWFFGGEITVNDNRWHIKIPLQCTGSDQAETIPKPNLLPPDGRQASLISLVRRVGAGVGWGGAGCVAPTHPPTKT